MAVDNATAPAANPLVLKLRSVHVGLREDLEVSRHWFRGEPSYVVADPLTFQSQQFSAADYHVLVQLTAARPLSAIFEKLKNAGKVHAEDEEGFYQFILQLHRLGFLRLPLSDDKLLYKRAQAKLEAKRREFWKSLLFLRIPLVNPDAFLNRTQRYVKPLFSRWAFACWLVLVVSALVVGFFQRAELAKPLDGILAATNLPVMWATLIVLKYFHEMGHAYACKHYGGHVPEMGAYLILFTPCAYVDATASWGFTNKWHRVFVCLAGMYVESVFAALAVFVWSLTEPSLINSIAYNVIFLAGTITVLFNVNPLMKYDGYYVMSDVTEVPNLRARAASYTVEVVKRWTLGLSIRNAPATKGLAMLLFGYGVCATVYRVLLVIGMAAVIASKVFLIGLSVAGVYVANTLITTIRKVLDYLWHSEEAARVRWRAVAIAVVVLVVAPLAVMIVPVPATVRATGVVQGEHETVVRAGVAGFVDEVNFAPGDSVTEGVILAQLRNDELSYTQTQTTIELEAALIREHALMLQEPAAAQREHERVETARTQADHARRELARTTIDAASTGVVVDGLRTYDVGRHVPRGSPIATIVAGGWQLRTIITQEEMAASKPFVGQVVEFRPTSAPAVVIPGRVHRVAPAGSKKIEWKALTHDGGGDIPVNPLTEESEQPFFELVIALSPDNHDMLKHGMTGQARLPASAESLAKRGYRRVERFINKLIQQ